MPTPCNDSRGADRLRCSAHPGYAGVGVPGELHHCRGRKLDTLDTRPEAIRGWSTIERVCRSFPEANQILEPLSVLV